MKRRYKVVFEIEMREAEKESVRSSLAKVLSIKPSAIMIYLSRRPGGIRPGKIMVQKDREDVYRDWDTQLAERTAFFMDEGKKEV